MFQDSALRPYKEFVDKRMKRITEAEMKEMLASGFTKLPGEGYTTQPSTPQQGPDSLAKGANPFELGANLKDMQRAFWINYELT